MARDGPARPASLEAQLGLANALLDGGQMKEAIAQCHEILDAETAAALEATTILGAALAADGQFEQAIPHLKRAVELRPGDARAHFQLALVLCNLARSQRRADASQRGGCLQPDDVQMLLQTAWILATSPDPVVRDGARAIELSRRAIQLSGGQEVAHPMHSPPPWPKPSSSPLPSRHPTMRSTMALARNDTALADAIDQRTRLYRQGLPYRQPAPSLPSAAEQAPPAAL